MKCDNRLIVTSRDDRCHISTLYQSTFHAMRLLLISNFLDYHLSALFRYTIGVSTFLNLTKLKQICLCKFRTIFCQYVYIYFSVVFVSFLVTH